MSYLQLDLTAFDHLSALTFRAGLPDEDRAIGGLTRLWLHCWRRKTATVELLDICVAFRVRSQAEQATEMLVEALAAYGFIEPDDHASDFYTVCGAEKRLGLLKARQKAAARMRGETAPQPPEAPISPPEALPAPVLEQPAQVATQTPPAPQPEAPPPAPMRSASEVVKGLFAALSAPKGTHETTRGDTQETRTDNSNIDKQRHAPVSQEPAAPVEEKAGPGATGAGSEHQQLVDAIGESYQRIKGARYAWTGRDFSALKKLKTMGPPLEIVARWELALQAQGYRSCTAVYELPDKWNAHPVEWHGPGSPEDFDQRPAQEKRRL